MRRVLYGIIAVSISLTLVACGNSSGKSAPEEKTEATEAEKQINSEELKPVFSATINEAVLVDEQGVKITAKELSYSAYSADLHLFIENNTDKELSFYAGTLSYSLNSINGYMIPDGYISEDVAPGMSANETMSFDLDQLLAYGITDIADIGIGFNITAHYEDYLKTGPLEIRTSIVDSYDYNKDTFKEAMNGSAVSNAYGFTIDYKAEDVLFDDQGVKILNEFVITNKDGEQSLLMEVENNSEKDLYVLQSDVSVNNISVSGGLWDSEYVIAGKKAVLSLEFNSLLEKQYMELLGLTNFNCCGMTISLGNDALDTFAEKKIDIAFGEQTTSETFTGKVLYDENGFQIMQVGLMEDSASYSDDLHALILVKNDSGKDVYVDTGYSDVYVNKLKVSDITFGVTAPNGKYALLDIELMGSDLKDNDLDFDNITEISAKLEFSEGNYNTIAEAEIKMEF